MGRVSAAMCTAVGIVVLWVVTARPVRTASKVSLIRKPKVVTKVHSTEYSEYMEHKGTHTLETESLCMKCLQRVNAVRTVSE
jgi:hypothetical protein